MNLLDRLGRRPAVIAAGWAVAAVLAVLAGLVGISVIGDGLTTRQAPGITEADALKELAGLSASPTTPAPPTPTASPTAALGSRPASTSIRTRGGTVVAACSGIITMSPAQGFAVHEQGTREGEFRGIRDNHNRVKVELTCSNGAPTINER